MNQNDLELDSSISESLKIHGGMYVFADDVTKESVGSVIEWILWENFVSPIRKKELLLMVCSEGGDMEAAFALIDVMRTSSIPVKTVGLGQIASCGLLIFMAGTPGKRILTPNTSILSHQFSWESSGKTHELFATVREFELANERMMNHYRVCTGQTDAVIKKHLLPSQDKWLSAAEALKFQLCDVIGNPEPVVTKRAGK